MLIAQSLSMPRRQPGKLTGYSMVTLWSLRRSNWWMKRYIDYEGSSPYTREDVVEFHCHGELWQCSRCCSWSRSRQPSQENLRCGRFEWAAGSDLAESIADLVELSKQPQTALAGLQGKLAHPIRQLRAMCLDILAEIEARIDFEEDPPLEPEVIVAKLSNC